MNSISKVEASLASNTFENIATLFNIKYDFSLFKVEAPEEFHALGNSLSSNRRSEAEEGTHHQTARRLSALFDKKAPLTPNLVSAYGRRVSEVSQTAAVNPRGSRKHGPFESTIGADGTSIWAAATSGGRAIAVHLLACMLARMWSEDEATSAWEEIVQERQEEMKQQLAGKEEPQGLPDLFIARQKISRKELASWDASARAWLRRADEAKAKDQTQLMLILKNLSIWVNKTMNTYSSVMEAWTIALTSIEKLICGTPVEVPNGAALLGISAFHLYPTLNVLKLGREPIIFHDPLVPATGILTLGIEERVHADSQVGVRWSLPLAHLRFYGEPVVSSRSINQESQRVSMADCFQIVLGAVLKGWGYRNLQTATPALRILSEFWLYIQRQIRILERHLESAHVRQQGPTGQTAVIDDGSLGNMQCLLTRLKHITEESPRWPILLAQAAYRFCESGGWQREQYTSLQRFGWRNDQFVNHQSTEIDHFWFDQPGLIAKLIPDREDLIIFLRKVSEVLGLPNQLVIKYPLRKHIWCLVTGERGTKRDHEGNTRGGKRWFGLDREINHPPNTDALGNMTHDLGNMTDDLGNMTDDLGNVIDHLGNVIDSPRNVTDAPRNMVDALGDFSTLAVDSEFNKWSLENRGRGEYYNTEIQHISRLLATGYGSGFMWYNSPIAHQHADDRGHTLCHLLCGESDGVGLYFIGSMPTIYNPKLDDGWTVMMENAFKLDAIDCSRLVSYFDEMPPPTNPLSHHCIQALCTASAIYKNLHGATVSLEAFRRPLSETHWASLDHLPASYKQKSPRENEPQGTSGAHDPMSLTFPMDFDDSIAPTLSATHSTGIQDEAVHKKSHRETWISLAPLQLDRPRAFSCIIYFETGVHNISPNDMENVMAVSTGDSIFVSKSLTCDPSDTPDPADICRLIGNIGLPGVSLLVPPANPLVRKPDFTNHRSIQHDLFDGALVDKFTKTQMNLWFTGSEHAIGVSSRGARDTNIYLLEAVVRVYDAETWVADLDILRALHSPLLHRCPCKCPEKGRPMRSITTDFTMRERFADDDDSHHGNCSEKTNHPKPTHPALISIDNWEEFLQPPEEAAIFRARGNWLARLAATCLSIQSLNQTLVLPEHVCWACIKDISATSQARRNEFGPVRGKPGQKHGFYIL